MTVIKNLVNLVLLSCMLAGGLLVFGTAVYLGEMSYIPDITLDECGKKAVSMPYKTGEELILRYQRCAEKKSHIDSIKEGVVYVWSLISTVGFGHKTVKTTFGRAITYGTIPLMLLFKVTESYFGNFLVTRIGDNKRLSRVGFFVILGIGAVIGILHAIILSVKGEFKTFYDCLWFLFIGSTTIGLGDEQPPTGPYLWLFNLFLLTIEIVIISLIFGYNLLGVRQFVVSRLERFQDWVCSPFCGSRRQRVEDSEDLNPAYLQLPDSLSTGHTLPADVNGPTNFTLSGVVSPEKLLEFEEKMKNLLREYGTQEVKVTKDEPARVRNISQSLANIPGVSKIFGSLTRIPTVTTSASADSEEGNSAAYSHDVQDTRTTLLDNRRLHVQELFERPASHQS